MRILTPTFPSQNFYGTAITAGSRFVRSPWVGVWGLRFSVEELWPAQDVR